MRYTTATAFRQALEQRLKNESAQTDLMLARLRKRVAFELFLRRLLVVAPDRWVLKGALALDFRFSTPTRATKDIDLGRDDDEDAAIRDITAAQQLALDDFFTFSATRSDALDGADEFSAVRFHVVAQLAGRTFEQFRVDVAFLDAIPYEPDTIHSTDLLSFADIPPLSLPVIPIVQHLAEKVHAYTRIYGEQGRASTRPKDLVDILLISDSATVGARTLTEALEQTFRERNQQPLPSCLPPPPPTWADPYKQLANSVGIETDLELAHTRAATFLDPILAGNIEGRWDIAARVWRPTDESQHTVAPRSTRTERESSRSAFDAKTKR
ncbi:MAG TPA: nucleotidyl transferase AbiEii/AbiGii toxin family protein [Solirubrobacteraceae bacterium]